jgi:hypothetical protein
MPRRKVSRKSESTVETHGQTESVMRTQDSPHGRSKRLRLAQAYTDAYLKGYEVGYTKGRNQESQIRDRYFQLFPEDVKAIADFALSIGYIDHEKHGNFLDFLKRLDEHVANYEEDYKK